MFVLFGMIIEKGVIMSIQVSRVKGIGYKFNYEEPLFSFIKDKDKEYDFIDIIGLNYSYYSVKKDNRDDSNLKIITDGMDGEYKYVLFLEEASYIDNSHGDSYWCKKYKYDNHTKKYAKEHIETLLQRELGDLMEFDFQHYE